MWIALSWLWCAAGLPAQTATPKKPNIIVIIADDLGYGDVSVNGATEIVTPAIDRLAREGRRFTSGYCTASTCTPTRYSLITGQYAFRKSGTGIAPPNAPALIPPGTETVASLLKRAGYKTAAVGKWHLGFGDPAPDWNGQLRPGPLEIGFDRCLLLPTTNDRVPQVLVEDHRVRNLDPKDPLWVGDEPPSADHRTGVTHRSTLRMDWSHGHNGTIHNGIGRIGYYTGGEKARFRDEDLADTWVQEAAQWIESQKNSPFFLYLASHDLHVPRMPHERFQGKSKMGWRGDSILSFDWTVGEVVKTVERLGLAENTMIVLCSDNGPVLDDGYKDDAVTKLGNHKPAGPYRGGKTTVFEGGTRIPFVVWWKGRVAPAVSDEIVSTIDFPATFAALAGVSLPGDACPDSFDLSGVFLGTDGAQGRPYIVQQDNGGRKLGFRMGEWKLVRQFTGAKGEKATDQLFHLRTDIGETTNVAAANPEVLERMRKKLTEVLETPKTRP
jgi:arylsulfatase A